LFHGDNGNVWIDRVVMGSLMGAIKGRIDRVLMGAIKGRIDRVLMGAIKGRIDRFLMGGVSVND
jgi:hypothetical protein